MGVFGVALVACDRPIERPLRLEAGARTEAELAGGEKHVYPLELTPGEYASLVVDQLGIDVKVSLYAADGRRLTEVDSPASTEGLWLVAETAAGLRMEVSPVSHSSSPGRYAILVEERRPATAQDRERVVAERTFADAEALRRKRDGKSLRRALVLYQEVLASLRDLGARGRQADVLDRLGRVYLGLGEAGAAAGATREAVALFRQLGEKRKLGVALTILGNAYRRLGEPDRAVASLAEALEIDRAFGRRHAEGATLNNLGRAYASLGRAEEALLSYEQALAVFRQLGVRESEGRTLQNLGSLYDDLGRREQALTMFGEALALFDAPRATRHAATALERLGTITGESGRPEEAVDLLLRALTLIRSVEDRGQEAITLNNLGLTYDRLERLGEAREAYRQALEIFQELGDRRSQAVVLANLGGLRGKLGQGDAAVESYRQALALFAEAGDPHSLADALRGLAYTLRRQGDLAASKAAIEQALERIETLRTAPGSPPLRSSFFASKQDHYSFYVDLLMELHEVEPGAGYDARAFEASERARARSLLDLLAQSGADLRRGIDPELLRREADLVRQLNRAERRRSSLEEDRAAPERRAAAEAELRRLLLLDERMQAEIRRASPLSATLSQAQPSDLRKIQEQLLDGRTLLLEYSLGTERSFVWAVTPSSVESFALRPRHVIEAAARQAHALLAASHQALARVETSIVLAELSELLLRPVAEQLDADRLIVVADGALHYIPFGALPIPGPVSNDSAPAQPLIVNHEVVTLPSASSLAPLRRKLDRRSPAAAKVAVLADPVFDAADPRVALDDRQGPERPAAQDPGVAVARNRESGFGRWPRLPFARVEAKAILEVVPPADRFEALDFAANRGALGKVGHYRILHLATHGFFDPEHPELSGIVLSMVDDEGRPQDGLLRAHEIYRMELAADLVVLSACQTALGKVLRGEGLLGLTRAFMVAGARRVVVSLWQVEDLATAELMERFYREMLVHGRPPAAALRRAQVALRQQAGWEAPYYWAGFVLHGDWK